MTKSGGRKERKAPMTMTSQTLTHTEATSKVRALRRTFPRKELLSNGLDLAWVEVEKVTDLAGPAFLVQRSFTPSAHASEGDAFCLALNSTLQRVDAQRVQAAEQLSKEEALLRADDELQDAEVVQLKVADEQQLEPRDVMQVWVATRILDTPAEAPRYTLRSAEGKFLAAERSGSVGASSEARGPQEEWTLVKSPDLPGFHLRSFHGKYLTFDHLAGGKVAVRTDFKPPTDERGGETTSSICVKVQWKFRHEARKRESGRKPVLGKDPAPAVRT